VRRPTLFSLWRKARRENSAASRLLGSTSLRFALHGWQRGQSVLHPALRVRPCPRRVQVSFRSAAARSFSRSFSSRGLWARQVSAALQSLRGT
ncbi:hypothetical protein, partial [Thiolapillus sp.]|uniref:hypothetical protein n=1 Tax=Thiolapillus sp. TaxID=2017437 RepID=UPI003AF927BC